MTDSDLGRVCLCLYDMTRVTCTCSTGMAEVIVFTAEALYVPMTAIWPRHATMHRRIAAALVVHVAAGTRAAAAADDGARASTPDTAPEHPASHHHAFRPTYRRDQWVAQHGQSGLCRVPCGRPPLEIAIRLPAAGSWTQEEGPRRVDA